jgi:hypothetical protein
MCQIVSSYIDTQQNETVTYIYENVNQFKLVQSIVINKKWNKLYLFQTYMKKWYII